MTFARISVTVPEDLLAAADRRARELDRPRSWVVAEAVRAYLAPEDGAATGSASRGRRQVSEPAPVPYAVEEVASARRRHLEAELRLTPVERLRRAEELGRLARERQHVGHRHQIIGFDSYEDYYEWKKARRVGA
jgi:hypothetical protein